MTKNQIMEAALFNFGEHGYNGGSLAQIAEQVGIKKQSIYTYFKSKDEIYLTIAKNAMQTELDFMKQSIEARMNESLNSGLFPLLTVIQQRFSEKASTKFFITSTFLTPKHLENPLLEQTYFYLDSLEVLFIRYFEAQPITVSPEIAANSFLAILDSLYVEMLYGGEARFEKRLQACWHVFYRGITN
ncbi:TetR/AcrR family transcriptional regulator [Lysinibacillus sp. 2017]|uniref:TetR/AcrR family transcriptional regulator n=1 Tax=unclassified Lysinibacillus TaxID=2636778 RepID=UPI000D5280F4|nr:MULTISPECIES: TetR/AcrR family transcriptional regulator [unclassified Lysinibacillus]AWE07564.1 TetR/AcrR family transcriptional regulator [Lysinibacillus sp. 2017]TGN36727.1 TetR/AcrR family transcriptional regulator [Lysinibacillus sp. S2017]